MHVAIRRCIQQLAYSVPMPEPQESIENKYLGNRMLFTLENQHSHTRKVKILYERNNYETNALTTRSRAIYYTSGTIAEKPKNAKYPHRMKFELDLYVMSLPTVPNK